MVRKTTARDVALAAKVSLSTVDRVLNNRGGVTKDKEKAVLSAARRLKLDRALNLRDARTLRVAVLVQPPSNPFHAALRAGFDAENRGANPFNMQFRIFLIDPAAPERTAARIATLGDFHDALVICAAHHDTVAAELSRMSKSGKPVITLATAIRGDGSLIYVGPDNRKAGRVAGDLMGRLLPPDGGDIVMIAGMLSMVGHEEREMGFRSVLRESYPHCRVQDVLESRERAERAGDLVFEALRRNPNVRGIYNASSGARPIVDVLRKMGLAGKVVFITHELTEERRNLLRSGMIDAIIDQNPALEVRTAVEAVAAHFGRLEHGPATTVTPVQIHMIENC